MKTAIAMREDKMAIEYIDRAAVEKFIEDGLNNTDAAKRFGHDAIEIMAEVHYMPAAAVTEVIPCRECTHYEQGACLKIYQDGNLHPEAWQKRKPEDFCSYGERKDGGAK